MSIVDLIHKRPAPIFYGQCGEDKCVFERYFSTKRNGVFLELGALNGVQYSNTKFFEDSMGWSGVLIEPNPVEYEKLVVNRPRSSLHNCIISVNSTPLELYMNGAVSSVKKFTTDEFFNGWHANKVVPIRVIPTRRLDDILHEQGISRIDFWSLDVEGAEYDVLQTMDWSIAVGVLCIEMSGGDASEMNEQCRNLLRSQGFRFDGTIAHNELWIRDIE
jgi:FkbM family methyltransferase